jgi:Tfp pilus assembly protein PilF
MQRWLPGLGLIVLTWLALGAACRHEFVNYDDPVYVIENKGVHHGLSLDGLRWAFTTYHAANWHPLTWLSLQLDYQLFGLQPWGYHLTNLLLHTANVLLLYGFLRGTTGAVGRSFVAAALFAVHPLHVESVAWVAERKDVLSTFLGLLALLAYAHHVRQPGWGRYLLVLAAFALSLLAKPMLVTLPFLLLLLDYWPLDRLSRHAVPLHRLVLEKIPLLILTIVLCLVTVQAQSRGQAVLPLEALPLSERIPNAVVSYVTYLFRTIWPVRLAVFYPHPRAQQSMLLVLGAAGLLVSVTVLVLWYGRRRPYLPVGWLWYVGTLVPVIGLVQVGQQAAADRYTYVPLIGIFVLVVWGVADLLAWLRVRLAAAWTGTAIVLLACVLLSRSQIRVWQNSGALWEHALSVTTNNAIAHNNMGNVLKNRGEPGAALREFTRALEIDPNLKEAHNNRALMLRRLGRLDEAIHHYHEALRLDPSASTTHINLGVALAMQGRLDEAVDRFMRALELAPDDGQAHHNLGLVRLNQGRLTEAEAQFRRALEINPHYRESQKALDEVRRRLAQPEDRPADGR